MLSNADCRVQLRSALQTVEEAAVAKISTTTVKNVTCKEAAERLICKALKVRRDSVGQLLKCVRYVNVLEMSQDDLGQMCHFASSEPFFDSSYKFGSWERAIPIDEHGLCQVADEIGDPDKSSMRPKKWGCTI